MGMLSGQSIERTVLLSLTASILLLSKIKYNATLTKVNVNNIQFQFNVLKKFNYLKCCFILSSEMYDSSTSNTQKKN